MIRRPPRATRTDTLFPDTTLFRSRTGSAGVRAVWSHHLQKAWRMTVRALVVDDSPTMRALLNASLSRDPDIEVVGAASNAMEGRQSAERRVGKECVSTCKSRWSPYH